MPELADNLRRLFGRLFGASSKAAPAPLDEVPAALDGATALSLTEASVAEAAGQFDAAFELQAARLRANLLGQPVSGVTAPDARGALSTALGLCMSGLRATAFLTAAELEGAKDLLTRAAQQHLPLVVHLASRATSGPGAAVGSGHEAYHAIANAGLIQLFASTVQEAVDFTLLAHRVAEQALVPVVVAVDWEQTARSVQDCRLPSPALVSAFLGGPEDQVQPYTPAQTMLFGETRRRVPRWYDLERPALYGARLGTESFGVAAAGQRPFFYGHVPALLEAAAKDLSAKTGRTVAALREHAVDGAEVVLVAQGAAVETAVSVAEHLRAQKKVKVGVIGVGCLRPLSGERLATLLGAAKKIVVLERADAPLAGDGPLLTELYGVAHRGGLRTSPTFRSAFYGLGGSPLRAADLARLVLEDGPSPAYLGVKLAPQPSAFPKRQAMLDALHRAYPQLGKLEVTATSPLELRPERGFSAQVFRLQGRGGQDVVATAGATLFAAAGGGVRTRAAASWEKWGTPAADRLLYGEQQAQDLGDALLADVALVCDPVPALFEQAVRSVREGGALILETRLSDAALSSVLPAAAVRAAGERKLTVSCTSPEADETAAAREERLAGALLAGARELGKLDLSRRKLTGARKELLAELPAAERDARAETLGRAFEGTVKNALQPLDGQKPVARTGAPAAVEQLRPRSAAAAGAIDSLPRFWGEVGVLYGQDGGAGLSADPYLSTGAVPPLSSAFREVAGGFALPQLHASKCTGCTQCFTLCPESAIAPLAIGAKELLEGAISLARARGNDAEPLRAMVSKLAPKVNKHLKESGVQGGAATVLRAACGEFLEKASLPEDRKKALLAAFEHAVAAVGELPVAKTAPFFDDPERARAGDGELFTLAVDASSCKGCGECVAACADGALTLEPADEASVAAARAGWQTQLGLPDTSGASIARARKHPKVGELPALLLSRHTLFAMAPGDGTEPGSGARTSLRLAVAAGEYQLQRKLQAHVAQVAELRQKVSEKLKELLAKALPTGDLQALAAGLDATERGAATLAELTAKVPQTGAGVDVNRVRRLVAAGQELSALEERLTKGPFGLGRARMGLVIAPDALTEGLGTFPYNPFQAPAVIDDSGEAASFARGALEGQLREVARGLAALRRARLELDKPVEAQLSDEALSRFGWSEMTAEERALCPPVVLVGGSGAFSDRALARLLEGGLPVKVVLLSDGGGDLAAHRWQGRTGPSVLSFGLGNPDLFVLQSSMADPHHLGEGLLRAFEHPGPALVHLHAPSPSAHGFATDRAAQQARLAIDTRAFPLFAFDPAQKGVFGTHLSLAGNPEPGGLWSGGLTPADWAATEGRFAAALSPLKADAQGPTALEQYLALDGAQREGKTPFVVRGDAKLAVAPSLVALCDRRVRDWRVLQELAGVLTPFTEQVKAEAEQAVAAAHAAELAALKAEYEAKLQGVRAEQKKELTLQVTQRLMTLAGHPANGAAQRKAE